MNIRFRQTKTRERQIGRGKSVAVIVGAVVLIGGTFWGMKNRQVHGSIPAATAELQESSKAGKVGRLTQAMVSAHRQPSTPAVLQPVKDAYNYGHYSEAEAQAQQIIVRLGHVKSVKQRMEAAQARSVMAYAAARRRDLSLARQRFALLETDAATLPGGGVLPSAPGDVKPSLTEDAAYQHAVCTAALGNKTGAEAEYVAFMKRFPESPLVAGAVGRIEQMHEGKTPPSALAAWQWAQKTALSRQEQRQAKASVCGPECLAELLRRRGKKADVATLAQEMGTGARGTTLAAMAEGAKAHGFHPQGLILTQKGLAEQAMPVIALVQPGHYVLVEATAPTQVTIWDPDARGVGQSARRTLLLTQWGRVWSGPTLTLEPAPAQSLPVAQAQTPAGQASAPAARG